jgi:hypothetical protein
MSCLEQVLPWRTEDNLRRSTSSNPQENYQNTTASSLFCKTANDQVISKSDAASETNGWQHLTASNKDFQVLLWTMAIQVLLSEILKDDFKFNFNQANNKWPLWTFFLNSTWKICRAYSTYFAIWIITTENLGPLHNSFIEHIDCVSTDTALLDVMYVEIEDRSSDRNKHKHTQHNYTSRQVVSPQI